MPKCEFCGAEVELPFQCNYCGKHFCEKHRLLENHDCPNAPPRIPLGSYQSKRLIADMKRTKEIETAIPNMPVFGMEETTTYEGKYNFRVPTEVYSDEEYRKKLNNAKTLDEVEHIIHDYYKHHPRRQEGEPNG